MGIDWGVMSHPFLFESLQADKIGGRFSVPLGASVPIIGQVLVPCARFKGSKGSLLYTTAAPAPCLDKAYAPSASAI